MNLKHTITGMYVCTCVRREADKDMVVGGYRVPKGTVLSMPTYASQLSPYNFTDPEKFLPERWLKTSDTSQVTDPGEHSPTFHGQALLGNYCSCGSLFESPPKVNLILFWLMYEGTDLRSV